MEKQFVQDMQIYLDILVIIYLISENIRGYAKGIDTESDSKTIMKRLDSNHEYNVVKLNNKWYLIDSIWGEGYICNSIFKKEYNPYYFCINPALLINIHYPLNENWQLLEKPLNYKQFMSNLRITVAFYEDGFYKNRTETNQN